MEEEKATPYPLRTEDFCDVVCEPIVDYGKHIAYQGISINKAIADYYACTPNSTKSADFILRKNNRLYYVEGKTLNGKNSLDHLIEKGCRQASRIVIDIVGVSKTTYIMKEIKSAFEDYPELLEIFLLKGSRLIQITNKMFLSKTFPKNFKIEWNKNK